MAERAEQRSLDKELVGIDVGSRPRHLGLPDRQELSRVVPLVKRLRRIDAFVALQANEAAAKRGGDGLRRLGLADAGNAFDKQRLAEGKRQKGRRGKALVC